MQQAKDVAVMQRDDQHRSYLALGLLHIFPSTLTAGFP